MPEDRLRYFKLLEYVLPGGLVGRRRHHANAPGGRVAARCKKLRLAHARRVAPPLARIDRKSLLLGTALAYLVLYRMLADYGSARTSLVTYLLPIFALAYGALILDEPLRLSALLGLVLILGGVALGSGMVRLPRRATVGAWARDEAAEGGLSRAEGGRRRRPIT